MWPRSSISRNIFWGSNYECAQKIYGQEALYSLTYNNENSETTHVSQQWSFGSVDIHNVGLQVNMCNFRIHQTLWTDRFLLSLLQVHLWQRSDLNRKEAFSQLLYISLPVIIQMFSCSDTMFDSRLLLMYYCRCNGIFIRYHFYQVLPFSNLNYSDFWNIWARRLQSIFIWCNPVASFKFTFAEYCWIFGLITVFLNVKTPPPRKKNRI